MFGFVNLLSDLSLFSLLDEKQMFRFFALLAETSEDIIYVMYSLSMLIFVF